MTSLRQVRLSLVTFLLWIAVAAHAASPVTVTNTHDSGPGSLRAAVAQADADAADGTTDTITFSLPTGSSTITLTSGELTITGSVFLQGPGAALLAVDGHGQSRVFHITAGTAQISGLTLQNGVTATTGTAYQGQEGGGGLFNESAVVISECVLRNNTAGNAAGNVQAQGGGLLNTGTATLTACTFTDNTASYGIQKPAGGGFANDGTATLTDCVFSGNTTGNSSSDGGGFANGGMASLTGCVFSGNNAGLASSESFGNGGGLDNQGAVTLSDCVFTGNTAPNDGGGVYNLGGTAALTNCVLTQNNADTSGGGFENLASATLTFCTLTRNQVPQGGSGAGLDNINGQATLTDDIFYGDTGGELSDGSPSASITVSFCDVQGGVPAPGNVGDIDADPKFVSPVNMSAPGDLHVALGSPAVGTGVAEPGVADDIAGFPRADPPNMGAYEFVSDSLVTNTHDSGIGSLRAAVTYADANPGATITFTRGASGVITLTSGELILSQNVTVQGPGAASLAVDGHGQSRVFHITAGTARITGLTLQNGSATGDGGGLLNSGAAVTVSDCVLTQNKAGGSGGGLENDTGGTATLTNCVVIANSAMTGLSGGIGNGGTLSLTFCTLTQNEGGVGSSGSGKETLTDDILYGDGGELTGGGASVSYSDVQGDSGTPSVPDTNHNFGADPMFVSAPDNLHLSLTSPCIGDGQAEPDITQDINGFPRSTPPNIGAYEFLASNIVVNTSDSGGGSLRSAAAYADANPGTVIVFAPHVHGKIVLTTGEIVFSADMTVQGPGASLLAIDGGNQSRVFHVTAGSVRISGLTLQNGIGGSDTGGGLANGGTVTLTSCVFTGNSAESGGGLSNSGTATLTDCTFTDNKATNFGGGLDNGGTVSLTGCTFTGNDGGDGGGVFSGDTATLTGCTLYGNSAEAGGGLENGGTLTLTNCLLVRNKASVDGGGLVNTAGTATMINCTSTLNMPTALDEGPHTTAVLTNDIFYGDSKFLNYSSQEDIAYCDIEGGHTGVGNIVADPKFVSPPSANAPGDLHLSSGSPCIGAGTGIGAPTADFSGNSRPFPPSVGAYDVVYPAGRAATHTTLSASTQNNTYLFSGQPTFFIATVTGGGPTGAVALIFTDGAGHQTQASGFLSSSNGVSTATVNAAAVPPGKLTITAFYAGDVANLPSTSGTLAVTILPALTDVTARLAIVRGGYVWNPASGMYVQTVTLTNAGTDSLPGPLTLVLDGLTGATLANAAGKTQDALPAGSPYVQVTSGALAPGASARITLRFPVIAQIITTGAGATGAAHPAVAPASGGRTFTVPVHPPTDTLRVLSGPGAL